MSTGFCSIICGLTELREAALGYKDKDLDDIRGLTVGGLVVVYLSLAQ